MLASRLEKTKRNHICMKIALLNKLPDEVWKVSLSEFKIAVGKWF